eukprot:385382_1
MSTKRLFIAHLEGNIYEDTCAPVSQPTAAPVDTTEPTIAPSSIPSEQPSRAPITTSPTEYPSIAPIASTSATTMTTHELNTAAPTTKTATTAATEMISSTRKSTLSLTVNEAEVKDDIFTTYDDSSDSMDGSKQPNNTDVLLIVLVSVVVVLCICVTVALSCTMCVYQKRNNKQHVDVKMTQTNLATHEQSAMRITAGAFDGGTQRSKLTTIVIDMHRGTIGRWSK